MTLCYPGRLSLFWFLVPTSAIILLIVEYFSEGPSIADFTISDNFWSFIFGLYLLHFLVISISYFSFDYQIAIRASFLGCGFTAGVYITLFSQILYKSAGYYVCILSLFHYSEFLAIAWCNPSTLKVSSFVLNQSKEYAMALAASWAEFLIESVFMPDMKSYPVIVHTGLLICIFGEIIRKTAMYTAATNFNHLVQVERDANHKLVTHGIYSICRHPSYVGWFLWSVGTQILLMNPICFVIYGIVSWRFFNERIFLEEQFLLKFFGVDYIKYQEKVGTGLPFIEGFIIGKYN